MQLFEALAERSTTGGGYEALHFFHDPAAKLRAVVAIHNSTLGPALGGTRALSTYPSEELAITDVLRLARGMTYKAALAGLAHGGGKAVILLPTGPFDREKLFLAFGKAGRRPGRALHHHRGTPAPRSADMQVVSRSAHAIRPRHPPPEPGWQRLFPPRSRPFGTFPAALRRCAKVVLWHPHPSEGAARGRHCSESATSGTAPPAKLLTEARRRSWWSRTSTPTRSPKAPGRTSAADLLLLDAIFYAEPCDVFSPNRTGPNPRRRDHSAPAVQGRRRRSQQPAGEPRHGQMLQDRGILYAPDYAINAGGLINVAPEWVGYDAGAVRERAARIHDTLLEIFSRAQASHRPTAEVADRLAEERFLKPS